MKSRDLTLFTLINICNYLDRYIVNAVLPLLLVEMSLTYEQGGRLVSAFVLGYVAFSPIFGYLGDRVSRPFLMFLGVFLWSLATFATGAAWSFGLFFAARIFVGIGEASFGTIAPGYIKDHSSDPAKLNMRLSIFFTAIPVGSALGYVLGGLIAHKYSWHAAFLLGGIPGFILSFLLLRYPEIRRSPAPPQRIGLQFRSISRIEILRYAIGGYILNTFALTGVAAFVAKYGVNLGFELDAINFYFGMILVCTGLIGTLLGGKVASKLAARSSHPTQTMLRFVGILSLCAVLPLGCTFLVGDRTLFLVLCGFSELLIFAGIAPINSIIVLESPPELVTFTQGTTILMINLFGSVLGPVLIGVLADHSTLGIGMQLATISMLLSGVVWYFGGHRLGRVELPHRA